MEQQSGRTSSGAFFGIPAFWKAQMTDWKVTVVRTSLERLGYQIIYPYLSLYIISLGAQKTQLGLITSIGMVIAALLGPITGSFIDRLGPKPVYVTGIIGLLISYLTYAFAQSWQMAACAMIIYYIAQGTSSHSCGTICGNCLQNCDRAKGMLICESLAAGLLGMVGPQLAVFALVNIIGADRNAASSHDYHYLFFMSAGFTLLSLFVVLSKLSNRKITAKQLGTGSVIRNGLMLLSENKNARKWIIIGAIGQCTQAMVLPYIQVFAGEVKMASVSVLGTMVTASALTSTLFGYFVGAAADRIGRKKVLYIIWPLYWASLILLMIAPSPAVLILSGVLQGFYHIAMPLAGAVSRELVEQKVMGTWLGITRLTGSLASAVMAILAGMIYDKISPIALFCTYIALSAFVMMPLLVTIPETLKREE